MLRFPILLFVVAMAPVAASQTVTRVDHDERIEDWYIFDLDGDGNRDLLTLFERKNAGQRFSYARQISDRNFAPGQAGVMPKAVAFALGSFRRQPSSEIAVIAPQDVVLWGLNDKNRLAALAPVSSTPSLARTPLDDTPPFFHWATDVDGDGRDDLFLPGDEGVAIHFGAGQGRFTAPLVIPLDGERVVDARTSGFLDFVRSYPRPVFADLDGDARLELCWFDEQGFAFLAQTEPRVFDPKPRRLALDWLSSQAASGLVEQTDVALEDLDGDGRVVSNITCLQYSCAVSS